MKLFLSFNSLRWKIEKKIWRKAYYSKLQLIYLQSTELLWGLFKHAKSSIFSTKTLSNEKIQRKSQKIVFAKVQIIAHLLGQIKKKLASFAREGGVCISWSRTGPTFCYPLLHSLMNNNWLIKSAIGWITKAIIFLYVTFPRVEICRFLEISGFEFS